MTTTQTTSNSANSLQSVRRKAIELVDHSDRAKGLFSLRFDLPGEKVNKFSTEFMTELNDVLDQLSQRRDISCLVFFSQKEGIYIAGADIDLIKTVTTPEQGQTLAREGQDVIAKIEQFPFPTVAAINGACLGGGAEFALCCSYILVSDHSSTKIGLPEVNLGVLPGMGGTVRLPRRIGLQSALDFILTGKTMNGQKALKIGFADALVSAHNFEEAALEWCSRIIQGKKPKQRTVNRTVLNMVLESTLPGRAVMFQQARKMVLAKSKGHYPAPLKILDVMSAAAGKSKSAALALEQKAFGELAASDVSKRLIELFFSMERVKKQTGVSHFTLSDDQKVRKLGLLGAGVMGGGIAQLAAHKGVHVRMKDVNYKGLAVGLQSAQKLFQGLVKKRKLTQTDADLKYALISPTTDYSGFSQVDLVIEAIVENMDVKKAVLQELETHTKDDAIFATNTSSLSVTEMATALKRPERMVGMHFFNPVHKMPLIEVIRGEKTSDRAVAAVFELSKRLGKTPIVVKDGPGFLVNRLLMPFLNEASFIIGEGAPIELLDQVVTEFGMPMGPATLLDEIGIDVAAKVGKILHHAFGERAKPSPLTEKLTAAQLFGKKSGTGFYLYDEKGRQKELNPQIYQHLGTTPKQPTSEEKNQWVPRMIYAMVNEAARCLDEKIVETEQDLDLAMIMGTGFPPFRGGLMKYAHTVGISQIVKTLGEYEKQYGSRFKPSEALR